MGFLKNFATAMKPSNIARGLDAVKNPPSKEEIEASLAYLTPEQRARYDENQARVEAAMAESRASFTEAKAVSDSVKVLDGPAGKYLYGHTMSDDDHPDAIQARIDEGGVWAEVQRQRSLNKGEFKKGLKQSFNISDVPQEKDPARRQEISSAERAQREAARAPYRPPGYGPVSMSRLATRGETQLAELIAYLESSGLAARPDLVYGVYRVPDRISGPMTPQSEKGRVVEWDVVHAPLPEGSGAPVGTAAGSSPAVVAASFAADEQLVARRLGEPAVLDEELALAYCLWAGIPPERSFGLARISEVRALRGYGGEGESSLWTLVRGVVALHPPGDTDTYQRLVDTAPFPLDLSGTGVHIEVLNWEAIGKVVQPKIHHPPACPSPFPYLPSTPQELLRSYLEIVGLRPGDCYSAQATFQRSKVLQQGGIGTTNLGPQQMCADGKARMRTAGCEVVVVVYRDSAEYAAGRERWAAYQRDVLQAHLERGTGIRQALWIDDISDLPSPVRAAVHVSNALGWVDGLGVERIPPARYCWPPVDATAAQEGR